MALLRCPPADHLPPSCGTRRPPSIATRSEHREVSSAHRSSLPATSGVVPMFPRMPDIEAHITGTVWKIECKIGDKVAEGDTVVILESMKMEMPVEAEDDGTVREILVEEGQAVSEGDPLVVLE